MKRLVNSRDGEGEILRTAWCEGSVHFEPCPGQLAVTLSQETNFCGSLIPTLQDHLIVKDMRPYEKNLLHNE